MKNIILIGMSGSGKTTTAKALSNLFKIDTIDTDDILQKSLGMTLQSFLEQNGGFEFSIREEEVLLDFNFPNNIIVATGGSVVYSEKLMNKFKNIGKIVYLNPNIEIVKTRIDSSNRGIVGILHKTYDEIFFERQSLYKKYADFIIEEDLPEEVVKKIVSFYEKSK